MRLGLVYWPIFLPPLPPSCSGNWGRGSSGSRWLRYHPIHPVGQPNFCRVLCLLDLTLPLAAALQASNHNHVFLCATLPSHLSSLVLFSPASSSNLQPSIFSPLLSLVLCSANLDIVTSALSTRLPLFPRPQIQHRPSLGHCYSTPAASHSPPPPSQQLSSWNFF